MEKSLPRNDTEDGYKYSLEELKANCEKWTLNSDLKLLSHLKQFSNDLINKTENANKSINNLVFDASIHCVKVNNVINDFQMLANSQFVENRVYDEEIDDISTNGLNVSQNESQIDAKTKEDDIVPKIKLALDIGLNFLGDSFTNVCTQMPQIDSEEEEEDVINGLLANASKDEFSQRLLPFIIGSEDFIRDNFVGLKLAEDENPIIDLNTTKINANAVNYISANDNDNDSDDDLLYNVETPSNKIISNGNIFQNDESETEDYNIFGSSSQKRDNDAKYDPIKDETIESDDEDNDLFGIPSNNIEKLDKSHDSISDKIDSSHISPQNEISSDKNLPKRSMPSFHDELSAVISGKKNPRTQVTNGENEIIKQTVSPKPKMPVLLSSDSSDDESIFKISANKSNQLKTNSNTKTSLFDDINDDKIKNVSPQISRQTEKRADSISSVQSKKISITKSKLFDDEDDDDDDDNDLFSGLKFKKSKPVATNVKPSVDNVLESEKTNKKVDNKVNLFSDNDDDNDDLFSEINVSKSAQIKQVNRPKESERSLGFISELNAAIKQKNEYSNDSKQKNEYSNDSKQKNEYSNDSKQKNEYSNDSKQKKVENLFNDDINDDIKSDDILNPFENKSKSISNLNNSKILDISATKDIEYDLDKNFDDRDNLFSSDIKTTENKSNAIEDAFYTEKPIKTLSNDSQKQRAILGAKRIRRRPSKKVVRLTPITDFSENNESDSKSTEAQQTESIPSFKEVIRTISNTENVINSKPIENVLSSPSTEEEDIFPPSLNSLPNHSNSKPPQNRDNDIFSDNKTPELTNENRNYAKKSSVLFDTSDSDDEQVLSASFSANNGENIKHSDSGRISNIITGSNKSLFSASSSTDSSFSNKSDIRPENSKTTVNLFDDTDDDDDDLFASVSKKTTKVTNVNKIESQNGGTPNKKMNQTSLFSDDDDDKIDLFKDTDIFGAVKSANTSKSTVKTNDVNVNLLNDDDDIEDIFTSKFSVKKSSSKLEKKPIDETNSLFDDPLFASHS